MNKPDEIKSRLQVNLAQLHSRIAAACAMAGRDATSVQLVAVTKTATVPIIESLIQCGEKHLGENRPQQLIERARSLVTSSDLQWHLIGQLQANKIRSVLPHVTLIHSVDSLKLLQRIGRIASELQLFPRVLLQVNISGEESKSGFSADQLRTQWEELCEVESVQLAGLMTMAPLTEETDVIRQTFRGLRELRDELQANGSNVELRELSMGMSHDFEIAIEEGATLIRVGSLIFEGCLPS
ncbi:YggS family pyridoxal phosphate-dependent enzyme [Planctomicrobium sp. SH661]|uniref:YggS family pyridoxal phosphate-dependent enzyme n=1 Tax=Planctomicrobium sp. SH661 TaxID=3448124 RepID=UPI003F5AEFDF